MSCESVNYLRARIRDSNRLFDFGERIRGNESRKQEARRLRWRGIGKVEKKFNWLNRSVNRPAANAINRLNSFSPVVTDTDDRVSLEPGWIDRRDRLIESRILRRSLFGGTVNPLNWLNLAGIIQEPGRLIN